MKFVYKIEYPRKVIAIGRSEHGKEYRGVAICAEGDTFDVNKGKQIARMKAELKQLENILKTSEKVADTYFEYGNRMARRRMKAHLAMKKIEEKLGEF